MYPDSVIRGGDVVEFWKDVTPQAYLASFQVWHLDGRTLPQTPLRLDATVSPLAPRKGGRLDARPCAQVNID